MSASIENVMMYAKKRSIMPSPPCIPPMSLIRYAASHMKLSGAMMHVDMKTRHSLSSIVCVTCLGCDWWDVSVVEC